MDSKHTVSRPEWLKPCDQTAASAKRSSGRSTSALRARALWRGRRAQVPGGSGWSMSSTARLRSSWPW